MQRVEFSTILSAAPRPVARTPFDLSILHNTASASQPDYDRTAAGGGVNLLERPMERSDFVLTAMAPAGTGAFSRVQIQKTLFLLDRNIGEQTDGPHFDFKPYHYGPFDAEVYRVLENLEARRLVAIARDPRQPSPMHTLTSTGLTKGQEELTMLDQQIQDHIRNTVTFVRSVTFVELLSAIYRTYPEMAANSVVARRDLVGYPTGGQ